MNAPDHSVRRQAGSAKAPPTRRLLFEALEARSVLAADGAGIVPAADLVPGAAVVEPTEAAEVFFAGDDVGELATEFDSEGPFSVPPFNWQMVPSQGEWYWAQLPGYELKLPNQGTVIGGVSNVDSSGRMEILVPGKGSEAGFGDDFGSSFTSGLPNTGLPVRNAVPWAIAVDASVGRHRQLDVGSLQDRRVVHVPAAREVAPRTAALLASSAVQVPSDHGSDSGAVSERNVRVLSRREEPLGSVVDETLDSISLLPGFRLIGTR